MGVRILKNEGIKSIFYDITAGRIRKGDVVQIYKYSTGFAMQSGVRGQTVELCTECDLVEIDNSEADDSSLGQSFIPVGQSLTWRNGTIGTPSQNETRRREFIIGTLARTADAKQATFEVVWRGML